MGRGASPFWSGYTLKPARAGVCSLVPERKGRTRRSTDHAATLSQPSRGGDAMSWEAISAIGQAMSALALFGVFIQLSYARAEARRSVLDAMSNSIISVQAMSLDPRYLNASMKAHAALGGDRHPFVSALMA